MNMRIKGLLLAVITAFVFSSAPALAIDELETLDATTSMGGFFIESLTGKSPAALGLVSDGTNIILIGEAVAAGNYSEAAKLTASALANKAASAVPVLGQINTLASVGQWFGNYMYDVMGNKNFHKMYTAFSDYDADTWPKNFNQFTSPNFEIFRAHFEGLATDYASQVLKDAGYKGKITDPEAEKIVFEAFLAKAKFERTCDELGLEGKERNLDNVKELLEEQVENQVEYAGKKALIREEERQETLKLLKKAEEMEQEMSEDLEAELELEMAEIEEAMDEEKLPLEAEEPDPEPLPEPEETVIAETPEQKPEPEKKEEVKAPSCPVAWAIDPKPYLKDGTLFNITVTNISKKPVTGFDSSVAPVNTIKSGTVGWGSDPSFSTIAPGTSIAFTAIATGDAEGIVISFFGNGKKLGSPVAMCVHEKLINADGSYKGGLSGGGIRGSIKISISGTSVTGTFSGSYADRNQKVRNTASISGSYDPRSGAIAAKWSGRATGKMKYEGETYDVDEPISGSLNGLYRDGNLAGSWSGGSRYISSSGSWSAR
jgi:hypothetical protein